MNTTYYYTVMEIVTTFGYDPGKNEQFVNVKDFKGSNLRRCREEAVEWYYERSRGLENAGGYFLPFASPENFVLGKNAVYSVFLSLIEVFEGNEYEYPLTGVEDETIMENLEIEREILRKLK
ncbi:MAG: hypothetical protein EYC69_11700 [Bacteroidetes bacterium]|nr:MAG: hypothetical protein EYC69_11700 [Bacteroidota bacterium]